MGRIQGASICGTFALIASLLLARAHPLGNAGLYAAKTAQAPIMDHSSVPPEVRAILVAKCADCHSMQTRAPIYGRLAPISWLMERDIVEGRRAMNLSRWDIYTADQQQTFAAKIVQETKARTMPLLQYRLVHWNSRIVDADVRTLTAWTHETPATGGDAASGQAGVGDALRGKDVYEKRCTGCHAMTEDREGPQLMGVYGRRSGSVPNFKYSPALEKAAILWNDLSLEQWLTDPDSLVPGNNMDFHVAKLQERRDLIRFLQQASDK